MMTESLPQDDVRKRRIFMVEDHPAMRMGLKMIINMEADLEVCGELDQARGVLEAVEALKPDAILLDLRLKDYSGLDLIKDLRLAGQQVPILVLSSSDENYYARRVLNAQGNGYLMKEEAAEKIIEGLRTVLQGDVYLSENMVRQQINNLTGAGRRKPGDLPLDQLTDREFEIFEQLGWGLSSAGIGEKLGISPKTVDAHKTNIKEKLKLANSRELSRYAVRWLAAE